MLPNIPIDNTIISNNERRVFKVSTLPGRRWVNHQPDSSKPNLRWDLPISNNRALIAEGSQSFVMDATNRNRPGFGQGSQDLTKASRTFQAGHEDEGFHHNYLRVKDPPNIAA